MHKRGTYVFRDCISVFVVDLIEMISIIEEEKGQNGINIDNNETKKRSEPKLSDVRCDGFDDVLQGGESTDNVKQMPAINNLTTVYERTHKGAHDVEKHIFKGTLSE